MKTITCFPCAKVNLGLYVLAKREDGFHDLRTVFIPLPAYHDEMQVEFNPDDTNALQLTVEGYELQEPVEQNLVWKAYEVLKPYSPMSANVLLRKRIPMGAGLGGGSADAAFALRCFAKHCKRNLSPSDMGAIALTLGSDVPFFLHPQPCYAEGRGEKLEPIELPIKGMFIVVITPKIHISTRQAFAMVSPRSQCACLKSTLLTTPIDEWKGNVKNVFWPLLSAQYPQLRALEQHLYNLGALYVSLSGSGPSIFGLFKEQVDIPSASFPGCVVHSELLF